MISARTGPEPAQLPSPTPRAEITGRDHGAARRPSTVHSSGLDGESADLPRPWTQIGATPAGESTHPPLSTREHLIARQHHHLTRRERLTLAAAALRGALAGASRAALDWLLDWLTDH